MCNRFSRWLCVAASVVAVISSSCDDRHVTSDASKIDAPSVSNPRPEADQPSVDSTELDDLADLTQPGTSGDLLLARGTVYSPGGSPVQSATVTLVRDHAQKPRYLTVTTDETGFFAVYGSAHGTSCWPIWGATEDGRLGAAWVPSTWRWPKSGDIEIHLRGGQTVLHVRDKQHKPVANASVDVFLSGLDDMSEPVAPNIRDMLKRRTNHDGIAHWPCRLGDYDLGFEVAARGHEVQRQDHCYSGLAKNQYGMYFSNVKVFVLDGDHSDHEECAKMIEAQLQRGDYEELDDARDLPVASKLDG